MLPQAIEIINQEELIRKLLRKCGMARAVEWLSCCGVARAVEWLSCCGVARAVDWQS